MPKFKYKASNQNGGGAIEDTINADSKNEVYKFVESAGLKITEGPDEIDTGGEDKQTEFGDITNVESTSNKEAVPVEKSDVDIQKKDLLINYKYFEESGKKYRVDREIGNLEKLEWEEITDNTEEIENYAIVSPSGKKFTPVSQTKTRLAVLKWKPMAPGE